jgi:hypothetical protein
MGGKILAYFVSGGVFFFFGGGGSNSGFFFDHVGLTIIQRGLFVYFRHTILYYTVLCE